MQVIVRSIAFAVAASLLLSHAVAQEWTRFRGPNGTGVSDTKTIPTKWTADDYNWSVDLPGIGNSSPVVWGEKLFVLSADPKSATRYVICINTKDGSTQWTKEYASEPHHLHPRNTFGSGTPAVDAERVYVSWSTPKETTLKALDHAGNEQWSLDLGRWVSQHGYGNSPIVYEDTVILFNSQQADQLKSGEKPGESAMIALDRETGKVRWQSPRVSVRANYGTPCILETVAGPQLLATSTGEGVFSLNPKTGEKNWGIDAFSMRTVSSPIVAGGLIFGSTGSGGGGNYLVAVKPGAQPEIVYDFKRNAPYVPTPVAHGDLVFLFGDKGVGTCINAKTGEAHWTERLGSGFSGSPVIAGDAVYGIDEDGVVVVVAASKEFQLLGKMPLGEPSRATPAISGGHMYLRTYSKLFSIGG